MEKSMVINYIILNNFSELCRKPAQFLFTFAAENNFNSFDYGNTRVL